jgi:hypothetical protein
MLDGWMGEWICVRFSCRSAVDLLDGQWMIIVRHGLKVHIVIYTTMMKSYVLGCTVVVWNEEGDGGTFVESAPT